MCTDEEAYASPGRLRRLEGSGRKQLRKPVLGPARASLIRCPPREAERRVLEAQSLLDVVPRGLHLPTSLVGGDEPKQGLLFPTCDIDALTERVRWAIDYPNEVMHMKHEAAARADAFHVYVIFPRFLRDLGWATIASPTDGETKARDA